MLEENMWLSIMENDQRTQVMAKKYFHLDKTGKDYIVYTKNEIDENNYIILYVGIMDSDDNFTIKPINDPEEKELLKNVLKEIITDKGVSTNV